MELSGKVYFIDEIEQIPYKDRYFLKRNLVLDCTTYDRYTGEPRGNYPKIEFTGEVCRELDKFIEGELVKVSFSISGRKYEKDGGIKFFTSIVGYNIVRLSDEREPVPQVITVEKPPFEAQEEEERFDDPPF